MSINAILFERLFHVWFTRISFFGPKIISLTASLLLLSIQLIIIYLSLICGHGKNWVMIQSWIFLCCLLISVCILSGRKRRPSDSNDDVMDDCMAAMVLMSLSCSPKSTRPPPEGKQISFCHLFLYTRAYLYNFQKWANS